MDAHKHRQGDDYASIPDRSRLFCPHNPQRGDIVDERGERPMTDNARLAHCVTARSPFLALAKAWLDDLRADPKLSKGTKTAYESGLRTLLLPAFADSVSATLENWSLSALEK